MLLFFAAAAAATAAFLHLTDVRLCSAYAAGGEPLGSSYSCSPRALLGRTLAFLREQRSFGAAFLLLGGGNAADPTAALPETAWLASSTAGCFVVPCVGVHDVPLPFGLGPNAHLQQLFRIWQGSLPIPAAYSFLLYGSFVVQADPLRPASPHIVSLCTAYFFGGNDVPDCDAAQSPGRKLCAWLEAQLRLAGPAAAVYISGHVPPTAALYKPACLARYLGILQRYSPRIKGQFYGYQQEDTFLLQGRPGSYFGVSLVNASLAPAANASFRLYRYATADSTLLDYEQFYLPPGRGAAFVREYSAAAAYSMRALRPADWAALQEKLRLRPDGREARLYKKFKNVSAK